MVNNVGQWTEEDYSTYPKEKWCDMDYVANYVREQRYDPETTMENLVTMLILYFEGEVEDEKSCFALTDAESGMINIDNLAEYVAASGGIKEFDH